MNPLYNCKVEGLSFRSAERKDCELLLMLIRELARYEELEHEITADTETLCSELFDKHGAESIIAVYNGKEVGFALFFHNFSTFLGKRGIYLEDLFILPEFRGLGIGHALLGEVLRTARDRGCGRLEWSCLDENTPAIGFYESIGARQMSEWTAWRIVID